MQAARLDPTGTRITLSPSGEASDPANRHSQCSQVGGRCIKRVYDECEDRASRLMSEAMRLRSVDERSGEG